MVKKSAKKKAGVKKKKSAKMTPARLLKDTAVSKTHDVAQKALAKAILADDKASVKLVKCTDAVKTAEAKLNAVKGPGKGKAASPAIKKRQDAAKATIAKSKLAVREAKNVVLYSSTRVKDAATAVINEKKYVEAKATAIAAFVAKWEKAYAKKSVKKPRKKRRSKNKS